MPEELISEEIVNILQQAGQEVGDHPLESAELADILWFANQIRLNSVEQIEPQDESAPKDNIPNDRKADESEGDRREPPIVEDEMDQEPPPPEEESDEMGGSVAVENTNNETEEKKTGGGITTSFRVPAATAIPNRRLVSRSLYPLHYQVPSRIQQTLDIAATIKRSAEEGFCVPVQKPASQRWLDVAVVIEKSPGFGIWQQTIKEFVDILQRQGAFRDVKCWYVTSDPITDELCLQSQSGSVRNPKELVLMGDRRLILVLSDCVTPGWLQTPDLEKRGLTACWQDWLSYWGRYHPVTILQMLPASFWRRTALGKMELLWLSSQQKGALNEEWHCETRKPWKDINLEQGFPIPVVTLDPYSLNVWAKGTAGYSPTKTAGIYLKNIQKQSSNVFIQSAVSVPVDAKVLFNQFMNTASLQARKLAALMSAVPVQLPIVRLIQRSMMRMDSTAVHVAEVFFSGILKRVNEESDPEKRLYDFEPGIRELLSQVIPAAELAQVIDRISADIAKRAGYSSVREFRAQLFMAVMGAENKKLAATPEMLEFARVALETLQRLGGEYAEFVNRIESSFTKAKAQGEQSLDDELFWGQKLESYSFKTGQYVEENPQIRWEELEVEAAKLIGENNELVGIDDDRTTSFSIKHYLIVSDDLGKRAHFLTGSQYTLGRKPDCSILLESIFVSRLHATLLRCLKNDGTIYYRLLDGDGDQKMSLSGTIVNGVKVKSHNLEHDDKILFASQAYAIYQCPEVDKMVSNEKISSRENPFDYSFDIAALWSQMPEKEDLEEVPNQLPNQNEIPTITMSEEQIKMEVNKITNQEEE